MKNDMGLVSISFRGLSVEEIAARMKKSGLSVVEMGADVHCLPGDDDRAAAVKRVCDENGIKICAYGSYYRVGAKEALPYGFADVVRTASILGAETVRAWAFNKGSAETTEEEYAGVIADMRSICAMAAEKGLTVSLECHNRTLTDEYHSALKLLADADCGNLAMYWQPNQFKSAAYNKEAAAALKDYVTNVHVFNWEEKERFPLGDAVGLWREYRAILDGGAKKHAYMLEFMPHDTPEELEKESEALRAIMA